MQKSILFKKLVVTPIVLLGMILQPFTYQPLSKNNITTSTVEAATSGQGACLVQNGADNNLSCTSNDIDVSNYTATVIDGCTGTGDTATITLYANIKVNSSKRYDIGFWVSNNGQSPFNGSSCTSAMLPGSNGSCGDLDQGTYNNKLMGTFTVQCKDTDNDGNINVPVVTTWSSSNSNSCNQPWETLPSSSSKCKFSNNVSLPIKVIPEACTKTSNANACGQTNTTTGSIINNVCNATTPTVPANPANYGNVCTKTSNANACGQSVTTTGTIQCDGSCNAPEPVVPANPEYYGQACTKTSNANACGQTTTTQGTYACDNTCTATEPVVPANPEYYGTACSVTSDANACGATTIATGTYACDNSCTAIKPEAPANPEYYGTACSVTSDANACGATTIATGTYACDNSCTAIKPEAPANPEWYGQVCTSDANACGATATGTLSCNQTCSAHTPVADDINANDVFDCLESDVTLQKNVDTTETYVGSILTYSIAYQNLSAFMANNVVLIDTLPAGTTFVSSSLMPVSVVSGVITWNLGNLAGFATGSIDVVVDTDDVTPDTSIVNSAAISADNDYNTQNNITISQFHHLHFLSILHLNHL